MADVNRLGGLREDYPPEKVADMWEYHGYVLQMIPDYHGGNNYPKHPAQGGQGGGQEARTSARVVCEV